MKNLLYYKYVEIENVEQFRKEQFELCLKLGLLGKILVAHEGINGCVSGDDTAVEAYKNTLRADKRFGDIMFKEGSAKEHTFRKLFVKVKDEIITSRFGVDARDAAEYIEPKELKEALDKKEDIVLLDARNDYECKEGMFEGAINPGIDIFTQFKDIPEKLKDVKDKQIVTYCTGGIRCEKASAYLRKKGFKVKQLHGGILRYGEKCGNAHWTGKCFVFDRRGAVDINPAEQDGELGEDVKKKIRKHDPAQGAEFAGSIVHYYRKSQIAEIKTDKQLEKGMTIRVVGNKTGVVDRIIEHVEQHEDVVTVPLSGVRENDKIFIVQT